jgi:hypothetical protein
MAASLELENKSVRVTLLILSQGGCDMLQGSSQKSHRKVVEIPE